LIQKLIQQPIGSRMSRLARLALCLTAGSLLLSCSHGRGSGFVARTLASGGRSRVWYEYRPPGREGPGPVVIMLAGFHEAATNLPLVAGIVPDAARDGFSVVAAEGFAGSWDAGGCCGQAAAQGVDDVGFLADLIGLLVRDGVADPARVYLAGFSNGAMMTYTFACDRADLLAGALVAAGTLTATCPSHRPIDLLVIHQTGDPVVPYGGTTHPPPPLGAKVFPPVPTALSGWLRSAGCPAAPPLRAPAAGTVTRVTVRCPNGTTAELEVLGGGAHVWPRSPALDATAELVRFFHLAH
jgi:polyhydroxybutyrate depolymerase